MSKFVGRAYHNFFCFLLLARILECARAFGGLFVSVLLRKHSPLTVVNCVKIFFVTPLVSRDCITWVFSSCPVFLPE